MAYAMTKYPAEPFTAPSPDPDYDSLPPVLRGEWNTNPSQGVHDILYWVNKENPRAGGTSQGDSQFRYWDYPVQLWAAGQPTPGGTTPETPGEQPASFRILAPEPGTYVSVSRPMTVSAYYPIPSNVVQVTYLINGIPVGTATQPPYAVTHVPTTPGPASLQAIVQTVMGTTETTQVPFTVQ
jgi:hypothetical protein